MVSANCKLSDRLDHLSLLSKSFLMVGLASSGSVNGQVYHDFSPDEYLSYDSVYYNGDTTFYLGLNELDLDADGSPDFVFRFKQGHYTDYTMWGDYCMTVIMYDFISILPFGGNEILVDSSGKLGELGYCSSIGPTLPAGYGWSNAPLKFYERIDNESFYVFPKPYRSMGLRLKSGADFHYGWIRMYAQSGFGGNSLYIDAFSIETTPNLPIQTGSYPIGADITTVEHIEASDLGTNAGAGSVQVDFSRFACQEESQTAFYRIFLHELGSGPFGWLAPSDRYVDVMPNGSVDYTVVFPDSMLTSLGNVVQYYQDYEIIIVRVPLNDSLYSTSTYRSEPFQIQVNPPAVTDIVLSDEGNTGNSSDLRIQFKMPDENFVDQYKVYLVPEEKVIPFSLGMITSIHSTVFTPIGSDFDAHFPVGAKTIYGGPPNTGVRYAAFVMSIYMTFYFEQTLSGPSNMITFEIAPYPIDIKPERDTDSATW